MMAGQRGRVDEVGERRRLDVSDLRVRRVEHAGELLVHRRRIVARDDDGVVPVGAEQADDVFVVGAAEHRRSADLVAVEVEDRQHRAVAVRVEEAHALPRALERTRLGFAVADHARHDQVGVVERGAEGVHERVAELAAFVDRPRCRRAHVARDAARRRELTEEARHAVFVLCDVRVDLGVGALEVHVRDERRSPMARARDVDHVRVALADQPVEVHVDERQPGRCAPVAEQARLHVISRERLAQKRVRAAGRSARRSGSSQRASSDRGG